MVVPYLAANKLPGARAIQSAPALKEFLVWVEARVLCKG